MNLKTERKRNREKWYCKRDIVS